MAIAGEIANLIVALKLDDSGFTGKLNRAAGALNRMDTGLSRMGRGVGQVGTGLARLGTVAAAAAAGGLAAVVTTAATMEEAFIGVQKTVDETAQFTFEELRDVLRQMSSETGTAFEELSRIGEIGGALGVPIASLDEFIDVVNRLGVSTDLSVDDAATALGHLGTVLHLSGEDYRDAADGLVALGNAGASSEGQIIAIAERFAVAGSRAGLSTHEILALGSAVASMGIESEAGGTALSNTFNKIAVAIGTGGKEVEAFTDLLGINAKEFRRRWETDALGTFQEFLREVDKLPAIEQAVALEAAGITGARQQAAIGALSDGYAELGRQLEVVEDREGALNEESDKFFASTSNAFRKLRENVRLSAAAIGNELLPITNELITEFVDFLNLDSTQKGLKAFALDLAGGIRGLVGELKGTDFSGIISGMKLAAEVAKGAFDAFRSLPAPIQQLAIAALVANKVSGGAVGMIAKGLGNIAFGGLQGGLAGIFGGRGRTPLTPLYVAVTNQIPGAGGGPGGVVGAGGKSFLPKGLPGWLGFLGIAAVDFVLISEAVATFQRTAGDVKVAQDFERGVLEGRQEGASLSELQTLLADLKGELKAGGGDPLADLLKWATVDPMLGQQIKDLEAKIAALTAATDSNTSAKIREGVPALDKGTSAKLREGGGQKALPNTAMSPGGTVDLPDTAMTALTTTATQVTKLPSISSRLEQRARETSVAMREGFRSQTSASARVVDQARMIAARVSEARSATERGFSSQSGYLNTISRKNFSPRVQVIANITTQISTSSLQTQIRRQQISVGTLEASQD